MDAERPLHQRVALVTSTVYDTSKFNCNGYGFVGPWRVQNSGGGTTSPESPLQGLIKSHNTTQASMASNIGLCAIADAAKEMGYHNAISNASDIYSR